MPATFAHALARRYRQTAQENVIRVRQLSGVLESLRRVEIVSIVLPGAGLLPLYPDPGCRPMDDIDLLASPAKLPELRAHLLEMGFHSPERHPDIVGKGALQLDLHEDVVNSARVGARRLGGWMPLEAVWEERRTVEIDGVVIETLGLHDMVLYTCLHALRHGYSRLTWFIDLRYLLREVNEWDILFDRGRRFRLSRPLFYCLEYLRTRTGYRLPAPAQRWMVGFRFATGEGFVLTRALRDRDKGEWGDLLWSDNVSGIWRRSLFLLQTAFPGPEVLLQVFPHVPRSLFPLAYPLRIIQLLYRSGKQAAGWLSR